MKLIGALLVVLITGCTLNIGSFGTIEEDKTHGVEIEGVQHVVKPK